MGTPQSADSLVYEDGDPLFNVDCYASRDGGLLLIESESKETSEVHFVPAVTPDALPTVVRRREFGIRYNLDTHSSLLFLVSNIDGHYNYELSVASIAKPSEWRPVTVAGSQVLAHSDSRSLETCAAFDDFIVISGREGGFTQLWVVPLSADDGTASADAYRLKFEAPSFTAYLGDNKLFEAGGKLRIEYTSMTSPKAVLEFDIQKQAYTTLKVQPVPGYDASFYETARIEAAARDGTLIPVTLLWRRGLASVLGDKPAPLHLYG